MCSVREFRNMAFEKDRQREIETEIQRRKEGEIAARVMPSRL